MNAFTAFVAAFGRFLLVAIFLISGFGKLVDPSGTIGYIGTVLPLPQLAYAVAVVVEVGLSLFVLVGFQTRISALTLVVFTVLAAVFFHNDFADQNQMIHFLKNVAIAGGLLQIAVFGGGDLSIDARRAVRASIAPT